MDATNAQLTHFSENHATKMSEHCNESWLIKDWEEGRDGDGVTQ